MWNGTINIGKFKNCNKKRIFEKKFFFFSHVLFHFLSRLNPSWYQGLSLSSWVLIFSLRSLWFRPVSLHRDQGTLTLLIVKPNLSLVNFSSVCVPRTIRRSYSLELWCFLSRRFLLYPYLTVNFKLHTLLLPGPSRSGPDSFVTTTTLHLSRNPTPYLQPDSLSQPIPPYLKLQF